MRFAAIAIAAATVIALTPTAARAGDFGTRPVYPTVTLAKLLDDPKAHEGQLVRIEGKVEAACQKKGCWLVVTDGKRKMRVTFQDYGFFVPLGCAGKRVILEGTALTKTLSEADARHYASETKGGKPEEIHGSQTTVTMVATGVNIEGETAPGGQAPMTKPESGEAEAGSGSSR